MNDDQENLYKRKFTDFLDADHGHGNYMEKIRDMMSQNKHRLEVDLTDLRNFDSDLTRSVLRGPSEYMGPFTKALDEVVRNTDAKYLTEEEEVFISFTGSFGFHRVSPRELLSSFMSTLVSVEGIVTKCSLVRPKVVKSVHFCDATQQFITREYRDVTSTTGLPTGASYPTRDENGNLLTTEFGLCQYRDHQMVTIQEMPENTPAGQLPRSVDVLVEDDLVDQCKPGDRVAVSGIYRAITGSSSAGSTSGVFKTVIISNGLRQLNKEVNNIQVTALDLRNIKQLAKRQGVLSLVADSLAPSIYGHEYIKKALVLLLLGGVEKNLPNGTHLRGDINCLMVGDPGVAKSQLLRAIMNIAPLAISTTGRGSSGVGLTAAVTSDSETGERRLEAGAMVLADRGVVCIDEFDKMNEIDRVAIHEVMEQQTVTIAKAGIHAALNARCSVVAAANPRYGSYDHSSSISRNINLPDSLLSRFDLVFAVLDKSAAETDRAISEHVLRMHRYRRPGDEGGPTDRKGPLATHVEDDRDQDAEDSDVTPMYVKYDRLLHGPKKARKGGDVLTSAYLKKYLHYAKSKFRPVLTDAASSFITAEYAKMRQANNQIPVTARTLETMIRLSSAHAKLRLSNRVQEEDAEAALGLMNFAIYAEEVAEEKGEMMRQGKKRKADADAKAAAENGEGPAAPPGGAGDENAGEQAEGRGARRARRGGADGAAGAAEEAGAGEGVAEAAATRRTPARTQRAAQQDKDPQEAFEEVVVQISMDRTRADEEVGIGELRSACERAGLALGDDEIWQRLAPLEEKNRIITSREDGNFYFL